MSLRALVYAVRCDAWACSAERFAPVSRPVRIEGSLTTVRRELRKLGWHPAPGRGNAWWWCPEHARQGGVS